MEIDQEIFSMVVLLLPLIHERFVLVTSKERVHKVLVNLLVKLAQEKMFRVTDHLDMTIAVDWDVKPQKQKNKHIFSQIHKILVRTNELGHEISNNVVCGTIKGSDQPAHTRSLIRAFACRLNIL